MVVFNLKPETYKIKTWIKFQKIVSPLLNPLVMRLIKLIKQKTISKQPLNIKKLTIYLKLSEQMIKLYQYYAALNFALGIRNRSYKYL